MLVADIHHVSLNVSETARAVDFYTGVLGMPLLPRPDFGVGGAWLDLTGGRQLHLIETTVPPDFGQHLSFLVGDIDETVAILRGAGVDVRGPIEIPGGRGRQAFLADPDGNRLELTQPA